MIKVQPVRMGFVGMEEKESKKNQGEVNYYPEFVAGDGTKLKFYVSGSQNNLLKNLKALKVIDLFAVKKEDLVMVHMSISVNDFNGKVEVKLEGVDSIA
jgi:hypothetical protein